MPKRTFKQNGAFSCFDLREKDSFFFTVVLLKIFQQSLQECVKLMKLMLTVMLKFFSSILLVIFATMRLSAQPAGCIFKPPVVTINFGTGQVPDLNVSPLASYRRVYSTCPSDGHYSYTSFTSDCFRRDWFSLLEDHTAGDDDGNMMIVNASYNGGAFLTTRVNGLKAGTRYEFGVWMLNVCRITEKCPFPLLPGISILLQTPGGKTVAELGVGELERKKSPDWSRYQTMFTTPPGETSLILTMINRAPGGCGNDFVLDDITLRECVKKTVVLRKPKTTVAPNKPAIDDPAPVNKPPVNKPPVIIPAPVKKTVVTKALPEKKQVAPRPVIKKTVPPVTKTPEKVVARPLAVADPPGDIPPIVKSPPPAFPPPPAALTRRSTSLIQKIDASPGEITLKLYDNGEVDGDTISVYHNNVLLVSHARLSEKPVTFYITIDAAHPHHELVMVAENLGSIPPNTSMMVVNAGTQRYEVYISSSEQKNAKVVFDLK